MKIFSFIKKYGRKIVFSVSALFSFAVLTVSCGTSKEIDEIYSAINYTQEDVVRDEIKLIEKLLEKNPVEALWRSKILLINAPDFSEVLQTFENCCDASLKLYADYLGEKKYIDAKRIYDSLEAVDCKNVSSMEKNSVQLANLIESSMPVEKKSSSTEKVSKMINGTVTVFVDKGVRVEGGVGRSDTTLGSGFFITKNGYIITNHHVISECVDPKYNGYAKLYIRLAEDSETKIPARVVGFDKEMDLALLKTEVDAPYVFTLGSSSDLDVGDKIYVIGSPLGLDRTLTSGIVSATDRDLLSMGKVFQIDAAVSPGNSGGPMIDAQGRVQAVVFAGVQNYQGLNFAIPVECLKAELAFLFNGGRNVHGWMEAYGKTKRMIGSGAKNEGIEILYSMPGGKLSFSGMAAGQVIVAVNENPVYSMDDLHMYLLGIQSDSIVKVTALAENGERKTVPVYLAPRPENPGYSFYRQDLMASALYPIVGMELIRSSASNKKLYSIKKVLKGSAADSAGFSEGDPVQIVNCEPSDDRSVLIVGLYAKKKRNGYLDYGMTLAAPLDDSLYF